MKIESKKLPKSQLEITFELSVEELKPYLEKSATEMTTQKPLEGFRPGKAPYEMVKQRLGETAIMQHAVNEIIGKTFYEYIDQQGLEIVDQPSIDIVKMAAENPFIYKAVVSLLPNATLIDYKNTKVKKIEILKIEDKDVDKVIADLQKMRAKEVLVEREAKSGDRVELNFETFIDGTAIVGGKAEKYPLILGDNQMIPSFEDNVIGMKKDEEKEFELEFPKKYHNDKIAGKLAKFQIKLLAVYERQLPELDEEFAKSMGVKAIENLKNQIRHNLEHEKHHEAEHQQDMEIINKIISDSKFEDLPDSLINEETHKMLAELKDNVEKQGLKFEDYLQHLKKKEEELRLDFTPDAIKRVKTSIAIKQIALNENITVTDKEIDDETEKTLASYKMNPAYAQHIEDLEKNIRTDSARRYFQNVIINRKVVLFLREAMAGIKPEDAHKCDTNDKEHDSKKHDNSK